MTRRIVMNGSVRIVDDEWFSDEVCTASFSRTADVNESNPSEFLEYSKGCGGEVRAELHLDAQAMNNGDVRMTGNAYLYEGTSENTTDLDAQKAVNFLVPANNFKTHVIRLVNNETFGGDTVDFKLIVANFPV